MLKAHPEAGVIYRSSPIYPHECVWFLAHDFKTLMIESKGVLPEYKEFIFSCDMTSAYEYHKKFLQLLQADAPGVLADLGDALVLDDRAIHQPAGALLFLRDKVGHVHAPLDQIHDQPVNLPQVFAQLDQIRHNWLRLWRRLQ